MPTSQNRSELSADVFLCALGLATPTVITVASGLAARQGWLFRGGDVIEQAADLSRVVFDKTGTLTLGRPLVSKVLAVDDPSRALQLAASLEQSSRHPLAHALLQEAQRRQLPLLSVEASHTIPGAGVSGRLAGVEGTLLVGRPEWLQRQGVAWGEAEQQQLDQLAAAGCSLVAVALAATLMTPQRSPFRDHPLPWRNHPPQRRRDDDLAR